MKINNRKRSTAILVTIFIATFVCFSACTSNKEKEAEQSDFQKDFTNPDYTAKHIQRLERDGEGWDKLQPKLNLKKGMVVGDIGCGTGTYTFLIAEEVGETGKVYGLEIQKKLIKIMEERLPDKSLNPYNNVKLVLNRKDDTKLPENLLDRALMVNIHFHAFPNLSTENKKMIASTFRSMKPGGVLLIKDGSHIKEPTSQNVIRHYEEAGFQLVNKEENLWFRQDQGPGPEYFLTFKKP